MENISHLAVIFLDNHPSRLHHMIAVKLLFGKRGSGSKRAVIRLDALHPKIVCTIAKGSVKNGISIGGRKAPTLQLVQKRFQVARPQYTRVVMPRRTEQLRKLGNVLFLPRPF
jgi:hypothetical protein